MTVVFKLGGSLLDLPDLKQRLQRVIKDDYADSPVLILVGGGRIVDAVRYYDSIHHLDIQASHWLCVDLMNSTSGIFQMLSGWPLLSDDGMLKEWLRLNSTFLNLSSPAIVAPSAFYSPKLNATALPISWQCTSDSIAALLARLASATELVMLKSTDAASASDEPLLDGAFSLAVPAGLKVRVVNLRN
jgi:5-(aminomethyl)-3-furanmethanol phosphate kinase